MIIILDENDNHYLNRFGLPNKLLYSSDIIVSINGNDMKFIKNRYDDLTSEKIIKNYLTAIKTLKRKNKINKIMGNNGK